MVLVSKKKEVKYTSFLSIQMSLSLPPFKTLVPDMRTMRIDTLQITNKSLESLS